MQLIRPIQNIDIVLSYNLLKQNRDCYLKILSIRAKHSETVHVNMNTFCKITQTRFTYMHATHITEFTLNCEHWSNSYNKNAHIGLINYCILIQWFIHFIYFSKITCSDIPLMTSKGSMTLPRDLLIFLPWASCTIEWR